MSQEQQIVLDIPGVIGQLFVITLIPVSLGLFIRARARSFADKMQKPVKIASAAILALVIAATVLPLIRDLL